MSGTGLNISCPARSAAADVVLRLRMKGEECGLPSHLCLISVIPPMCRIHSNPHAIFSMVQGSLRCVMICPSGQGTKIIPACCKYRFIDEGGWIRRALFQARLNLLGMPPAGVPDQPGRFSGILVLPAYRKQNDMDEIPPIERSFHYLQCDSCRDDPPKKKQPQIFLFEIWGCYRNGMLI